MPDKITVEGDNLVVKDATGTVVYPVGDVIVPPDPVLIPVPSQLPTFRSAQRAPV